MDAAAGPARILSSLGGQLGPSSAAAPRHRAACVLRLCLGSEGTFFLKPDTCVFWFYMDSLRTVDSGQNTFLGGAIAPGSDRTWRWPSVLSNRWQAHWRGGAWPPRQLRVGPVGHSLGEGAASCEPGDRCGHLLTLRRLLGSSGFSGPGNDLRGPSDRGPWTPLPARLPVSRPQVTWQLWAVATSLRKNTEVTGRGQQLRSPRAR